MIGATPTAGSGGSTLIRLLTEQLRVQLGILAELLRGGGSSGGTTSAGAPVAGPPTGAAVRRKLTDEEKERADIIASSIIVGVRILTQAFDFAAQQIAIAGKQSAALIRGDVQQAKVADVEQKQNVAGTIGSILGTIAGFIFGGPIGSRIGSVFLGRILGAVGGSSVIGSLGQSLFGPAKAAQEKVNQDMAALRERTAEMSKYNLAIAQQVQVGNVARQQRDIAESRILGRQFAETEARQQQLDRINQMVAILEKSNKNEDLNKAINKEIEQSSKRLEKLMASTDENTRKMVKELEKQAKTPLQMLEERGGFAKPDERGRLARENELLDRMRDAGLNLPILAEGR